MTASHLRGPQDPTAPLLGRSPAFQALRAQIRRLASFDTLGNPQGPTSLLQGETGTGKGLIARVMHDSGPRADGPFLEINCAAIPDTLFEAQLCGYDAGAFSEARRAKPGLLGAASGGTFFLDDIDALPGTLQGKLVTALEAKRVRQLGVVREQVVDVKLIAAAQTDLCEAAQAGRFRADLDHRPAVIVLTLPPLQAGGEDIMVLARAYLERYASAHRLPPKRLSPGAAAWLCRQPWPGNVRELSHLLAIKPGDAALAILAKVTEKLGRLDAAYGPLLPAVLTLLHIPLDDPNRQALEPPQRRWQILEALKRLWLRASQVQPLLLVVDNHHWIDAETQAWLDHLAENLATARICLVVSYRPEYQHSWGSKTYYTQLRLDPLSADSAEALLRALLGDDASLQPVKPYLIHRTEGNPFFMAAVNVMPLLGWALTAQGRREEERVQSQLVLAGYRPRQRGKDHLYHLALPAEASAQVGQPAAGLKVLDEALAMVTQIAVQ